MALKLQNCSAVWLFEASPSICTPLRCLSAESMCRSQMWFHFSRFARVLGLLYQPYKIQRLYHLIPHITFDLTLLSLVNTISCVCIVKVRTFQTMPSCQHQHIGLSNPTDGMKSSLNPSLNVPLLKAFPKSCRNTLSNGSGIIVYARGCVTKWRLGRQLTYMENDSSGWDAWVQTLALPDAPSGHSVKQQLRVLEAATLLDCPPSSGLPCLSPR